jgi:hypothetical protein
MVIEPLGVLCDGRGAQSFSRTRIEMRLLRFNGFGVKQKYWPRGKDSGVDNLRGQILVGPWDRS